MQTKTKYVANDGTEFDNELQATQHEALCKAVADALAPLGKRNRSNEGWIQHNPETGRALLAVCRKFNMLGQYQPPEGTDLYPLSIVGRVINDSGPAVLDQAMNRFASIDAQGREHNQPYFAINGPDATQHEL